MASRSLVGYDSGQDSDSAENTLNRHEQHEQYKTAQRVSDVQDTLAAEWESFEKLIQAGNDGQSGPIGTEQNVISASTAKSSDLLKERVTGGQSTDQTFASKVDTRQKRVFREVESNSDHSSNADSEDESGPTLPGPGVTSSSNYKTSHHSSSSESSQSDDKFQATASLSEDDSSSDDDKPVETKSSFAREKKSSSSENNTSSDSDLSDKPQTGRLEVSDTKLVSQKRKTAQSDSSGVAVGGKPSTEWSARKEKSRSRQPSAQERIRAKLIAISEQSAPDVKRSQLTKSRDTRTLSHVRSPSPKRYTHSDTRRSSQHSRPTARRSRSRSGSGRHRHHAKDHRNRSRSADRTYRHHRDRRRHHSRERHTRRRSRHRSRDRHSASVSPSKPKNFKEQLKKQLFSSTQPLTSAATVVTSASLGPTASSAAASAIALEAKKLLTANEKPSSLPLNSSSTLAAMMSRSTDLKAGQLGVAQAMAQKVTPQQALIQTMAAMHQKAQQMTGVAVPSYYNPAAVNPLKYAEQLKKRKMLWSKGAKDTADKEKEQADSKTVQSVAQWTGTSFAADDDGKVAAKFRKLMGIREEDKALLDDNVDLSKLTEEQRRRQEELFAQLDKEYAFARMTTHTCRGVGLGFQSQGMPDT